MKAIEMMNALKDLIDKEGNDVEIHMTQSGYYSDGDYAEIYLPQKEKVEHRVEVNGEVEYTKHEIWSIGHSRQTY